MTEAHQLALSVLRKRGVHVRLGTSVTEITASVTLPDGSTLPTHTVVWTAGAADRVFATVGTLDHLITCAAGALAGSFAELNEREVRGFFEARFWRQYRCIKAALPLLAPDGSVVLMSGFLYRKPESGFSPYAAVNGAIEALVKVLAIEAAPIRVNALAPGQIDTRGGGGPMDEAAHRADRESVARRLPLGRIGTAGEVAHAALFLAENTFTTGITLDIDGGKR